MKIKTTELTGTDLSGVTLNEDYTSPTKREWVGLTKADWSAAFIDASTGWSIVGMKDAAKFVNAIEAALKEKNFV